MADLPPGRTSAATGKAKGRPRSIRDDYWLDRARQSSTRHEAGGRMTGRGNSGRARKIDEDPVPGCDWPTAAAGGPEAQAGEFARRRAVRCRVTTARAGSA